MKIKQNIIENLCYTELVYGRINKKLAVHLSKQEIEKYMMEILKKADDKSYFKKGKNYYVSSKEDGIRITINSYTFRIITVNKI